MPDGDWLWFRLAPAWRKVRSLLERQGPEIATRDAMVKAAAASLRRGRGVPDLRGMAQAMQQAAGSDDPAASYRAQRPHRADTVLDRHAEEVAQMMAVRLRGALQLVSPDAAAMLLAEKLVKQVARSGLDRMTDDLVHQGLYTAPQLEQVLQRMLDGEQLKKLATRLLAHPNGDGLRAPARQEHVIPHDELLTTDLGSL